MMQNVFSNQLKNAVPWRVVLGASVGLLIFYPLTIAVFWTEFGPAEASYSKAAQQVIAQVLQPDPLLIALGAGFTIIGGILGLGTLTSIRQQGNTTSHEPLSEGDLFALIEAGESANREFKSSLRWDWRQDKVNKALGLVAMKTLAGFANSGGGSLLIGVDDRGTILGLERDYATLKHKDRDGFEQLLMTFVTQYLDATLSEMLHVTFHTLEGKDLCHVVVEASNEPVYVRDGQTTTYYIRTGNATRALGTEEAVKHIMRRLSSR